MSRRARLPCSAPALGAVLLAAACGARERGTVSRPLPPASPQAELRITYWPHGMGLAGRRSWTLTCQPPGGDHPNAPAACAELGSQTDPLAPPRTPCPLLIRRGEPEATVNGRYRGRPVSVVLRPGCGTAWQRLHVLITGA